MPPTLANGASESDIDQANVWMRAQPWYRAFLASIGQLDKPVKLNDQQKQQLAQVVAANGFPVPDKDEIDPAGNINPKGHKMRNFLIAAAIGGAAVGGYYALPALTGGGGAAGAAGAAGAGGAGVGIGETAAVTGLAGSGFGAAAGAAGAVAPAVVAGASKGLGSIGWSNLIGAGTSLAGAAMQSRAVGKGAELEAQGQREALDFLKARDTRDYADQAPYRALGANAAQSLGHYLGFPAATAEYNPNATQGPQQAPIPAAPGVNVGDPRLGTGQPVLMVAPSGEEKAVPATEVQHWLSKGASIKPTGAASASPQMPMGGAPSLDDVLLRRTA